MPGRPLPPPAGPWGPVGRATSSAAPRGSEPGRQGSTGKGTLPRCFLAEVLMLCSFLPTQSQSKSPHRPGPRALKLAGTRKDAGNLHLYLMLKDQVPWPLLP